MGLNLGKLKIVQKLYSAPAVAAEPSGAAAKPSGAAAEASGAASQASGE